MSGDICYHCDGTGERDPFSGECCRYCGGSGWLEDEDQDGFYDEEEYDREWNDEAKKEMG